MKISSNAIWLFALIFGGASTAEAARIAGPSFAEMAQEFDKAAEAGLYQEQDEKMLREKLLKKAMEVLRIPAGAYTQATLNDLAQRRVALAENNDLEEFFAAAEFLKNYFSGSSRSKNAYDIPNKGDVELYCTRLGIPLNLGRISEREVRAFANSAREKYNATISSGNESGKKLALLDLQHVNEAEPLLLEALKNHAVEQKKLQEKQKEEEWEKIYLEAIDFLGATRFGFSPELLWQAYQASLDDLKFIASEADKQMYRKHIENAKDIIVEQFRSNGIEESRLKAPHRAVLQPASGAGAPQAQGATSAEVQKIVDAFKKERQQFQQAGNVVRDDDFWKAVEAIGANNVLYFTPGTFWTNYLKAQDDAENELNSIVRGRNALLAHIAKENEEKGYWKNGISVPKDVQKKRSEALSALNVREGRVAEKLEEIRKAKKVIVNQFRKELISNADLQEPKRNKRPNRDDNDKDNAPSL